MRRLLQEQKEKTSFKQRVTNLPKEKLLLLSGSLFIFILFILVIQLGFFNIKSIECKTQYSQCSADDIKLFDKYKNNNLLFINANEINKIGEENYSNSRVYTQRVFPSTLSIVIEKRKPIVALTSDDPRSPTLLLGQDGTIVEISTRETTLPTIKINREIKDLYLGQKVEQQVIYAVQIMYLVYKAQGTTSGILNKDNLQTTLSSGTTVYFALDRDPQALVGALQLIETRSRIEGKLPRLIDLRYIKPVLTY